MSKKIKFSTLESEKIRVDKIWLKVEIKSTFQVCSSTSDPEDLHVVVEGDADPVDVGGGPADARDLALGRVGQQRLLAMMELPDERLMVAG